MPATDGADEPETNGPTEHPPAGVGSLWRLRSYLRPHRVSLLVMAGTALLGVVLTIAIPLVTRAIIDGPILTDRSKARLGDMRIGMIKG